MLVICFITFSKSLLRAFFGIMNRQIADQYIHQWASRLLWAAKATVHSKVPADLLKPMTERCVIYMSNHTSLFDIPICCVSLPGSVRMLAKKELAKIFMFGRVLKQNEFIFIARHNRVEAIADLKRAAEKMQDGIRLWVSPEGTRSKDGQLLPFKKGVFKLAMETQAVIIPVGIHNAHQLLPAKTKDLSLGETITVRCQQPIDTQKYTNLSEIMALTRERILEALAGPTD